MDAVDPAGLGTAAIIATFLVPMLSFIKKPEWSHQAKYLLGMVGALVAASVGAVVDGDVTNVAEFVPYFGTAFASAQTLYNLYFTNTKTEEKLAGSN